MNIRKTFNSFGPAYKGVTHAIGTENNLQVHTIVALLVVVAGFVIRIEKTEWVMLILAIAIVYIAEFLNTALERLVDMVSPEYNDLAGKVKDIAAGSALLATISALTIGGIVFLPYLIKLV